jgi:glycosyltransferase involved in cell wall biosynthesis
MKVCLLTRFFDMRNAGLGRVSSEIKNGLEDRGFEVRTVSTNGRSLYSYFFYTSAGILAQIPINSDIYHAITPMEALWIPKNRSVVTFHDLFQISDPDKLGSGLGRSKWKNKVGTSYFAFVAKQAAKCAGIVAVSEKTKEDVVNYLGVKPEKITVIHSGIRPDFCELTTPFTSKKSEVTVGYLGQLDRRKRVDLLIKAFKKSKLTRLIIGGIGVDGDVLKDLAGDDKRIEFRGLIPDNLLCAFYNSMDVMVFPTWLEGYGLPIVEAMACKRPVVILDDAIIPMEIKQRCVLIPELEYLLCNTTYLERRCQEINYAGNYKFAKEHTWEAAVDKYLKVYGEVLASD